MKSGNKLQERASSPLFSRVLVIVNPAAGSRGKRKKLRSILDDLRSSSAYLEVVYTETALDATRLVKEKGSESWSLIVCAGGDGTINEVMNGMMEEGFDPNVPLAILPTGTGNGLAREIGLSLHPWKAYRSILDGAVRPIYLGKVDRRYFVLMGGIGFDAYVVDWVERRKGIFRRLPKLSVYILFGLTALFFYPYPTLSFLVNGIRREGSTGIIAKSSLIAGPFFVFTPETELASPSLTLCLLKAKGPIGYLWTLVRLTLFRNAGKWIEYVEGREVEAIASHEAIQADGEPAGKSPARFTVAERPIHLVWPARGGG